jgi:hypothetical protein
MVMFFIVLRGSALAIRAALIPSRPRRTIIITALFGIPMMLVNSFLVPIAHGGFALRAADSGAYPWLPVNMAIMWGFAIITCVVRQASCCVHKGASLMS